MKPKPLTGDADTPEQSDAQDARRAAATPPPTLETLAAEGKLIALPAALILDVYRVLGAATSIPAGLTIHGYNALRAGLLRAQMVQTAPTAD